MKLTFILKNGKRVSGEYSTKEVINRIKQFSDLAKSFIVERHKEPTELEKAKAAFEELAVGAQRLVSTNRDLSKIGNEIIALIFEHRWDKEGGDELRDIIGKWDKIKNNRKEK